MTERQWFGKVDFDLYHEACEWLLEEKKNHRKLRLWSCACCRRLGGLLADKRSWNAIEVAERKADGLAGKEEVQKAREAAKHVPRIREKLHGTPAEWAASAPVFLLNPTAGEFSQTAAIRAAIALEKGGVTTRDAEERMQFELLRDIFGNPFHRVSVEPLWRQWNDGTIPKLARIIYEDRAFDRLPILADALEEAGCDNEDFISHCRKPATHVRGCWVVDLLSGRE